MRYVYGLMFQEDLIGNGMGYLENESGFGQDKSNDRVYSVCTSSCTRLGRWNSFARIIYFDNFAILACHFH